MHRKYTFARKWAIQRLLPSLRYDYDIKKVKDMANKESKLRVFKIHLII